LDFEKAYDKVHWGFLLRCLKGRGFNDIWCSWISQILNNGTVAVKLNNVMGPYFQSYKGVRHGDPLSPLLFNLVADSLTRMVLKAQQNDLVCGLIDHLIPKGIAILQYADDTILCLQDDVEKARHVKLLFYIYKQMFGLKINYEKSEVVLIGGDNNKAVEYGEIFDCQIGCFPIKYLRVPIAANGLHVVDWIKLEEKLKKLDVWQGHSLSIGDRSTLIKSSLSSSVIYHMSMFLLPKTTIERM
jgi:hypothetical protein